MKIETLAVHAGQSPDPTTKAVAAPIYQTVAYAVESHPKLSHFEVRSR